MFKIIQFRKSFVICRFKQAIFKTHDGRTLAEYRGHVMLTDHKPVLQ